MRASRLPLPLTLALLFACKEPPPAGRASHPQPETPAAPSDTGSAPTGTEAPAPTGPAVPNFGIGHRARWGEAAGLTYLEVVQGQADFDDELPVLVAIHGLGDRPENFYPLVQDLNMPLRVILPRGLDEYGKGWSWFPLRARSPDVEALSAGIDHAAGVIAGALDELERKHRRPADRRMTLTGFSQGGMLSFTLGTKAPHLFDNVVPIGGWLPEPLVPEAEADTLEHAPQFVALHGDADPAVKIEPTRVAVGSLEGRGYAVELHEYPGIKHAIPPEMRTELHGLLRRSLEGESIIGPAPDTALPEPEPAPEPAAAK